MHWKTRIHTTATEIARTYAADPRVLGVAIGGSIGRNRTWRHSDLELIVLVEAQLADFSYFNYVSGIGVEVIQLTVEQTTQYARTAPGSEEAAREAAAFPIQAYKCKIVSDRSGQLAAFKARFDEALMHPVHTALRCEAAVQRSDARLEAARAALAVGAPHTTIAHLRLGMNELLLAYYWRHGILPRSQNRAYQQLRRNTEQRLGDTRLLEAYTAVYGLDVPMRTLRARFFRAREDILLTSAKHWGERAADFMEKAVDSRLEWGHAPSMLCVYTLCLHAMQCKIQDRDVYDRPETAEAAPALHAFFGFAEPGATARAAALTQQYIRARDGLDEAVAAAAPGRS
ncbi:hypothetical protein IDH44_06390 [Paenibacillus sp. IB182496]|uniref:Nucleotidyltransferase domain-containing protein n=1 Tax=Paenibacillus sabuli TaxID=2772509 RepID=A0A927GQR9_9BACL|nr:hypothetical protein [Paenibacillus sabuli]MBD2844814.1 hypothetical protein [Paenibacillus sabuli]